MRHTTHDLKYILEFRKLDSSDFILIALEILKNEKNSSDNIDSINDAIEEISEDYLDLNYKRAIEKLIEVARTTLKNEDIAKIFEEASQHVSRMDRPEKLESRRYFETRYAKQQWEELGKTAYFDSLDRLAKFMTGANLLYSAGKDYTTLRKVSNLEQMELVIAAMKDFAEKTTSIFNIQSDLRNQDKSLSQFKDRGKKRDEKDVGGTMNPGIVKANTPLPQDELRDAPIYGSVVDSFLINRGVEGGYSATNVRVPYVNSVSGTAYFVAALLHHYILENASSPTLQQDIDNIVQTFIIFTCKSGYHSLSEMLDVLRSEEVTRLLEGHHLTIGYSTDQEQLDLAINSASDYVATRQTQKMALSGIKEHSLFKRHTDYRGFYPSIIAASLPENKQTGPRVAKVLSKLYEKGVKGQKKYTPEYCKKIAEQYLHYAKKRHPRANVEMVKAFIKKMDNVIGDNVEHESKSRTRDRGL